MPKLIHSMIRVLDLDRSVAFYRKAFGLEESHRLEFPTFALLYLRDPESGAEITYGDIRLREELQFSVYNFEYADVARLWLHLDNYEAEAKALVDQWRALREDAPPSERARFPILPAFDLCLKCSHLFNLLDARGAISVTERVGVIARIRTLAVGVAKAYASQQEAG